MRNLPRPHRLVIPDQETTSCRQKMRPALGTLCTIEACGPSDLLEQALEQAFTELTCVEQLMHPTRSGSDLARLAAATECPITIDALTWEVLALARRFHQLSGGCFDPCVPESAGCFDDVELLEGNRVHCHRRVAIDLGGIAKGYAVDRAVTALRGAGCESGLVNAGGDMRAFGDREQHIVIALAVGERRALQLNDRALAVSDGHAVNRPPEFKGYYLRHSKRQLRFQQAVIAADRAAVADALAKCALLCDEALLTHLLQQFEADLMLLQ